MSSSVSLLAELVHRESGVRLESAQHPALLAALARAWPEIDATEFLRLAGDPIGGSRALARLVDEVTVKETSFLRDRQQLETIDWKVLQDHAQKASSEMVRVWSAACATGEEPYSLALLACEAFASAQPPVWILATDISGAALAAAGAGRYGERALQAVDASLRRRYFEQAGGRFVVSEGLRGFVELLQHNLVRDPVPPLGYGPFDLIVCRNILIYFDSETAERLVIGLERALAPGGKLLLGAADALCGAERRLAGLHEGAKQSERMPASSNVRPLRRPLGRHPERPRADRIAGTLRAADEGRTEEALDDISQLIAEDALNADVYFIRGLIELTSGDAQGAVWSLRRALYLEPDFGLAAFKLGRAHEEIGDTGAARRSYEQALRTLRTGDERHDQILAQVDLDDVFGACRARLAALATTTE